MSLGGSPHPRRPSPGAYDSPLPPGFPGADRPVLFPFDADRNPRQVVGGGRGLGRWGRGRSPNPFPAPSTNPDGTRPANAGRRGVLFLAHRGPGEVVRGGLVVKRLLGFGSAHGDPPAW